MRRKMSRILVIEDEQAIADLERDYLELSGLTWILSMMVRPDEEGFKQTL
jgi:DNA-binding response OmpR family regulator